MSIARNIFRNAMSQSTYNHRRAEQIERSHKPITISVEDALASCEENLNNLDSRLSDVAGEATAYNSQQSRNHNNELSEAFPDASSSACIQSISEPTQAIG